MGSGRIVVSTLLLLSTASAHNWMNTPGRAVKVSLQKPCPPRQSLQQKHVQINPGGTFPVEWATGHEGSTGNWVLVRAEDERMLDQWSDQVGKAYFAAAPTTEFYKTYFVTNQDKMSTKVSKTGCGVQKGDSVFKKEVKNPYNRPDHFQGGGGKRYFEYNSDMDTNCKGTTWAGYKNSKFPWVIAASEYKIALGAATNGGLSLFKIPEDIPSGKYVLHWWWRRYINCLDVDVVVKSKKVTDIWGSASATTGKLTTSRIDHCHTWRRGPHSTNPDLPEGAQLNTKQFGYLTAAMRKSKESAGKKKELEIFNQRKENLAKQQVQSDAYNRAKKGSTYKGGYRKDPKVKAEKAKLETLKRHFRTKLDWKPLTFLLGKVNFQDWGVWFPKCRIVLKGENAAEKCRSMCIPSNSHRDVAVGERCDSVNVVPYKHPATSAFAGQVNRKNIPDACLDGSLSEEISSYTPTEAKKIPDDAYICYQLQEDIPTDGGPSMTITDDPEDPAWYSTCLKIRRSQQRKFAGPSCGAPCLLADNVATTSGKWRFGDQCVSCDLMKKNNLASPSDGNFVPEWSLAPLNRCKKCN